MDEIAENEARVTLEGFLKDVQRAAQVWGIDALLKIEGRIPVSTDMGEYRRNGVEAAYPVVAADVSSWPEMAGLPPSARVRWSKKTRKIEEWEIK